MNNVIALVDGVAVYVADDPWKLQEGPEPQPGGGARILPLSHWQTMVAEGGLATGSCGVLLEPDDDPGILTPVMDQLPLIALAFPSFRDGRAYSQASLLRTRFGFRGDLRAIGDVLRDQLMLMRHCGFSSFAVRADKSVADALEGFAGYDMIYARSVTAPEPLYRRHRRGEE